MTENAAGASSAADPRGADESPRPIVVGVVGTVGTDGFHVAACWAAGEAERRGTRLTMVHALHLPDEARTQAEAVEPGDPGESLESGEPVEPVERAGHIRRRRLEGREILDRAAASVHTRYRDLPLDLELSDLDPVHALTGFSREAEVLVIGDSGRGGSAGMLLGSVGRELAVRTHCPFIVVHEQPAQAAAGSVVLGADPEHSSAADVYGAGRREGAALTVVRVWIPKAQHTAGPGIGVVYIGDPEAEGRGAVEAAKAATERLRREFPDVLVQITADEGNTVTSLMAAGQERIGPATGPAGPAARCCRLAHVESSAAVVFGRVDPWRDLARRAMSHGADCLVLGRFLEQWELILGLPGVPQSAPEVCNRCSQRNF